MKTRFLPAWMRSLALALPLGMGLAYGQIPAFPGAEGFGAAASGGRGGQVVFVTNTNVSGPGSFQEALNVPGDKYILFRCSGVIDGAVEIPVGSGNITIAGQTSPNGIVVRGISSYNDVGPSSTNLIIRHLRSRCSNDSLHPTTNWVTGDGITLGGVHRAIVDHCSFGQNVDEAVDISRSTALTIQNCLLAETIGEHNYLGGMLTNYNANNNILDSLSIHHNAWSRIGGRLPEFSCEGGDCNGHTTHAEVSCNIYHDQGYEISYNRSIDPGGSGPFTYYTDLNFVNNYGLAAPAYCNGMFYMDFLASADNDLYVDGNGMNVYPSWTDYQLFSCCNDFCTTGPNTDPGVATHRTQRHPYPAITYTAANQLQTYAADHIGAFPRDAQDSRLIGYISNGTFLSIPRSTIGANDPFTIANSTAGVPTDTDDDGMPDYWETAHGLNPNVADHNGTNLSVSITGVSGYTNLECYINCLAEAIEAGSTPACGILLASTEPQAAAEELQLAPNPSHGRVEVSVRTVGRQTLEVRDLQGRLIHTQEVSGRSHVILDLSAQPAGIYILRLGQSSRKLVIE